MNETGVQTTPNIVPKLVASTGKKDVSKAVSAEQGQTVTAVCAMNATGLYVPPFFIFKRKRMNPLLIKDGPLGCSMAVSEKGYMTNAVFLTWLDHFKKYASPSEDNPVLLVLDNHISHINYESVSYARKLHIHMLSLPPHSSHKTQPLDRAFFKPLKSYYDAAIDNWMTSHAGQTVTQYEVAGLFKVAFERAATLEKATNGFRSTGIYPFDNNVFTNDDFLPSEVTEHEEHQEDIDPTDDNERLVSFDADNDLDDCGPTAVVETHPTTATMEVDDHPSELNENNLSAINLQNNTESSVARKLISPADIIPLPKIKIARKRTGNRRLKATLLTSTPNRERLERELDEKAKQIFGKKTGKPKTLFAKIKDIESENSKMKDRAKKAILHTV